MLRRMSFSNASRLARLGAHVAYVGDSFSGKDMAEMGWATYAVPPAELPGFTERFARRVGHGAHTVPVKLSKDVSASVKVYVIAG